MSDIESYEPRGTEIVSADGIWLEAHFEERMPRPGEALAVELPDGETLYAVVREHTGGGRLRAMLLGPSNRIEPGSPVRRTERPAGLSEPDSGPLELGAESLLPESDEGSWFPITWRDPDFDELRGEYPAVDIGVEGIDAVAPIAAGGVNLLVDLSDGRLDFAGLAARVADAEPGEETIWIGARRDAAPDWADEVVVPPGGSASRVVALRVATALAAHRRDAGRNSLVVGRLPAVSRTVASEDEVATEPGYGQLVDLLGSGLVSTQSAAITTLLHLPVSRQQQGVAPIVETLELGDVETQILVDDMGRFAPDRSTTSADLSREQRQRRRRGLRTVRLAQEAEERARLLGERELTEEQRAALEALQDLRADLG